MPKPFSHGAAPPHARDVARRMHATLRAAWFCVLGLSQAICMVYLPPRDHESRNFVSEEDNGSTICTEIASLSYRRFRCGRSLSLSGAKNLATRKRTAVHIKPCGAQLGNARRAKHTRQRQGRSSPTLKNSAIERNESQRVAACFNVGRRMVLRYEVPLAVSHERGGARTMKIERGRGVDNEANFSVFWYRPAPFVGIWSHGRKQNH